jgi:hypothetical protein
MLPDSFTNGHSHGYIRYELSIHYIKMNPVGFAPIDHFYIPLQVSKVSCQHRRGNKWFHGVKIGRNKELTGKK